MVNSDVLVVETAENPFVSIIWAHGLGADKHDFESVIPLLGLPDSLPVRFIFPNAPMRPITVNGGMQMRAWYDIRSTTINEQEDADGIRASAHMLSTLVEQQIEQGIAARNILLAGFSQGGAVALHLGLRYHQLLGGIIVLSSYLPLLNTLDAEISKHAKSTPVFMGHGNQDPIVPVELGLFARDKLLQNNMQIQFEMYSMGHSVSVDEMSDLGHWLKGLTLAR